MALFDGYDYGPQGYSDRGGLIDRLIAGLQQQGQYLPATGFDSAAPSRSSPTEAQPIAIGDYQMPRLGSQAAFTPDPAAIPQNAQPAQGFMPPQPQPPLPSFLQGPDTSPLGRIGASLQTLGHGGGLIGAINTLATGQRLDPQGQQQEALRAQYQSLIPILGEQKARLAVLNPDIGKALVAQALGGKGYTFAMSPDGTFVRQNAQTGEVTPAYSAGTKPTFGVVGENGGDKTYGFIEAGRGRVTPYQAPGSDDRGTVTGPDGKPIPIPPGVDPKTFRNEVSKSTADAATGKKTEVQAKSEKFANKMELADRNVQGLDSEYSGVTGGYMRGTEYLPGGNVLQSESYQKYKQARDNFITALLRDESGAAIGTAEFNRYEKELFPQPGDGPAVIKQKREARRVAIEAMKKSAGPGYKSPDFAAEDAVKSDIDALLKKYGGK